MWCAATYEAKDAERGQSRAACTPGKCGPKTGDDPRDPHQPDTQLACCQVLWHTRGERCTTGPVGCGLGQGGSHAVGEELLRNQKMRSYRPHTASETKTVTIEPGREDTVVMHLGLSPGELQGLGTAGLSPRLVAGENRQGKKP